MAKFEDLMPYCKSQVQVDTINACVTNGSIVKAAKYLKKDRRGIARMVRRVERQAAAKGFAPDQGVNHPTPAGFTVRGTSTLYDAESGEAKLQWIKTGKDAENQEALHDALLDAFASVKPLPVIKAPRRVDKDLLTVYPMGDPHLGMYAWSEEAGEDFDTDIAAKNLYTAVDRLVEIAPAADTGILLNLGDFFHADNLDNTTKRGTIVDIDTRWPRVLDIGIQTMIRLIRRMLAKHKAVIVRNCIGNHDTHTSIMLSIALRCFFDQNKRVHIDTSPDPFWYYRHGKVLIGSTHGDRTKPASLPQIMAADRSEDWGQTLFRYWYTGHIHHQSGYEFPGCTVETFRTLAAKDAWHHGQGYRSGRDMRCIVLHNEYGSIETHRVGLEQLE